MESKHKNNIQKQIKRWVGLTVSFAFCLFLLHSLRQAVDVKADTETAVYPFAYGANVAVWDITTLDNIGFNWMKVFNTPGSRLPVNVLLRVDANASHMSNVNGFGNDMQDLAQSQKGFVDAYEIGNEPNLDATYGWGHGSTNVPPIAADYATLLCEAYGRIKSVDPEALVVSAGLAPTGRVPDTWNGHAGHNGLFQDERIYMQEMLDAMQTLNGGPCFDIFGYHPYGYSSDFDAPPDVPSADPARNCANGFCFRGVEKIYEILQVNDLGHKQIFVTEFGWITQPPDECLATAGWSGRAWQIVSHQKQADNLVGAYEYATTHYPWMGGMFLFNLNFSEAPWITDPCEQMRYYSVVDRPAEAALTAMPKVTGAGVGELTVIPGVVTAVYTPTQQPINETMTVTLKNTGFAPLAYTMTLQTQAPLSLSISAPLTGALEIHEETAVPLHLMLDGQPAGSYTGSVKINTSSNGVQSSRSVSVAVYVWQEIHETYLPLVLRP